MSFKSFNGTGWWMPFQRGITTAPTFNAVMLIDATGEKMAFLGRVTFKNPTGTKDITRVQFPFGTIVKAGGSALTVSLQDVSLTVGPPGQPDGTQDQTVAIANADAGFASNTWYRTNTFSANRTVSNGDLVAVVIEFDGAGRLGADSVIVSTVFSAGAYTPSQTQPTLMTGGTWANQASQLVDLVIEFSDGSFGSLSGSFIASGLNTHTFNSTTALADEYALEMTFPYTVKIDAVEVVMTPAAGADFEIVLYSGTTAIETLTCDSNTFPANASARNVHFPFVTPRVLTANALYRIGIRPTTANDVSIYSRDVNDVNHNVLIPGGTNFAYSTRVDQGAWSATTTTRRIAAFVRVSAVSTSPPYVIGG